MMIQYCVVGEHSYEDHVDYKVENQEDVMSIIKNRSYNSACYECLKLLSSGMKLKDIRESKTDTLPEVKIITEELLRMIKESKYEDN